MKPLPAQAVFGFLNESAGENPGGGRVGACASASDLNILPVPAHHPHRSDFRSRSQKRTRLPREMPRCECGGDCAVSVPDVGPVITLCIACGKEGTA